MINSNNLVIGKIAVAIGQNATAIGLNGYNNFGCIAIGTYLPEPPLFMIDETHKDFLLYDTKISFKDLLDRIKLLETTIFTLQTTISKQQEIIDALWYHPGMPGGDLASNHFDSLVNE